MLYAQGIPVKVELVNDNAVIYLAGQDIASKALYGRLTQTEEQAYTDVAWWLAEAGFSVKGKPGLTAERIQHWKDLASKMAA